MENATSKKRGGAPLPKKIAKKKKIAATSDFDKSMELDEDIGQETLSQLARNEEVRMVSLVFNSSVLTPPMLTPLGECFQNLGADVHHDVNLGEANLSSSQLNIGEDTLPSPVNPVSSPPPVAATMTANVESQDEGEIATLASQETAGPSSQRFTVETLRETAGDIGGGPHVTTPAKVEMQDSDLGGGAAEGVAQEESAPEGGAKKAKTHKAKGTTTITLDFDESDDDVLTKRLKMIELLVLLILRLMLTPVRKFLANLKKVFLQVILLFSFC
jgi:hypothetical protein